MQGSLRVDGRPALIKLRVSVDNVPSDGEVDIADVMLQPGGSRTGWLPHVTEMPWSAGVTPDEEVSTVYSRLNALESEVSTIRTDIEPITVAGDIWRGESVSWDDHIAAEWHPEHGWISWVDLAGLSAGGASGDIEVTFAQTETVSTSSQPARWGVQILTEDASGIDSLTARLDIIDSTDTKTAEKGQAVLDVWPTWSYDVRHDVILPADTIAEPRVILAALGSGATGRVGITAPWIGTAFERSE